MRAGLYCFVLLTVLLIAGCGGGSSSGPSSQGFASNVPTLVSQDGKNWTKPNFYTTYGNALNGITFGDGGFVSVGNGGTILTSPDGVRWVRRFSGTAKTLNGVVTDNGRYVAVGNDGTILTSDDGIGWTSRASGTLNPLYGITCGNGQFVAVGDGTVLTSVDRVNWTSRSVDPWVSLRTAAYGNGVFVAGGLEFGFFGPTTGIILTSVDGVTWNDGQSNQATNSIINVIYGKNLFVAVGLGYILTSADGSNWTSRSSPLDTFSGVAYGNEEYVAVGDQGKILTSPDGITWTTQTPVNTSSFGNIAFGNGRFVAAFSNYSIGKI